MYEGIIDIDVCVSHYLKEELAWAIGKWLPVISTIMLFKNSTGGGIGLADPAIAGPNFQNYNPQSLLISSECSWLYT